MTSKEMNLNPYELRIVESLIPEYDTKEKAIEILTEYLEPVRELGGYYGPEEIAESLITIRKKGFTPDQWLAHMRKLDKYNPKKSTSQKLNDATKSIDEQRAALIESELNDVKIEMKKMEQLITRLYGQISAQTYSAKNSLSLNVEFGQLVDSNKIVGGHYVLAPSGQVEGNVFLNPDYVREQHEEEAWVKMVPKNVYAPKNP